MSWPRRGCWPCNRCGAEPAEPGDPRIRCRFCRLAVCPDCVAPSKGVPTCASCRAAHERDFVLHPQGRLR